jgi:3-oxoacyl-[acyl-carrier-protein] synthase II
MNDFTNYAKEILGVKGASEIISASCASGTTAAGMALDYIRAGLCDCAVVGGVDSLSIVTAYGFNSLKSLSGGVCNPFDEERDGINIGECGALFLFESLEHAQKRNAKIYCEVAGYALGNDAYHITSPEPNGEGAYNTMKAALDDAGIKATDIDYINAHGTGTTINDSMETKAIEKLFANVGKNIAVSSTKSLIGHCMGASGAVELASIILSMQYKKYIPMPNLKKNILNAENIQVSNKTFDLNIDYAISNSFAFSGNSAALIVKSFKGGDIN